MRENRVKSALRRGQAVIGTMATEVKSPGFAQICAAAGFDFLFIDTEHGTYSLAEMGALIQMCRQVGVVPLVRVPDLAYHLIARVLDAGAMGVMVPRIETAEQVETMVSYVRYPPLGVRGSGGGGRTEYGMVGGSVAELVERLNNETLIVAQIERKRAIKNIESIAAVPGLDVCLVGPVDLSISLGVAGDLDHPLVQDAIGKVVGACASHGIASGGHLPPSALEHWWRQGMRMLMCNSDIGMLRAGCQETVAQLKAFVRE